MKIKYILLTAFTGIMLSACSDFLDRKPLTEPNNEEYLCSRAQVEIILTVYIWHFLLLLSTEWE